MKNEVIWVTLLMGVVVANAAHYNPPHTDGIEPYYHPKELVNWMDTVPEDISIELIDLRTIYPWDIETVVESVNKTGRCVIVHEAPQSLGFGAELAATIQARANDLHGAHQRGFGAAAHGATAGGRRSTVGRAGRRLPFC